METMETRQFHVENLFVSNAYFLEVPEFLDVTRQVSQEFLFKQKEKNLPTNSLYPVNQTEHLSDERLTEFIQYLCDCGFNILHSQGFNMDGWVVICKELWCQDHAKSSGHEEHVHGFGMQLTGIYFLDVPQDSTRLLFHDPRPAKRQVNMYEKDMNQLTYASTMVNFEPKPGLLAFTNSWLPHSFTRNASDEPVRFIHFNLGVGRIPNYVPQPEPIII
jgi:uncharacterized protein (TIGR02466 family)